MGTDKPTLRLYLRRSRADEGHQQFSLDVQRDGCRRFATDELPRRGMAVSWPDRVEYLDDDRAGDDFLGRAALQRLLKEARPGDVVLCRDQSRLGRDALEVTLATRSLVRDSGARLIYYVTGQDVPFNNAIDGATIFVQGVGHQMELEAIRSRTREALRSKVHAGRVAGGRCYGYRLIREQDASGRGFTTAEVDEEQAAVVRRIFEEYAVGHGLKRIAVRLNEERVPSPSAGRRGTASWSPTCVHTMLRNRRYLGEYIHGRKIRSRRGDKRIVTVADPKDVITIPMPAWRIVDDETWDAVHARLGTRVAIGGVRKPGPGAKYMLSGLARCGVCGGSIGVANTKISGGVRVRAYLCYYRNQRGASVCPVSIRQPVAEVDGALCDFVQRHVLTDSVIDRLMDKVADEIWRQTSVGAQDAALIEAELSRLKAEQKNLIQLAAAGGQDVSELASELQSRSRRMRQLDHDLAACKRGPEVALAAVRQVQKAVRAKLTSLSESLSSRGGDAREAFRALFPEGLVFRPAQAGRRQVFEVTGTPRLGDGVILPGDPTGVFRSMTLAAPMGFVVGAAA